MKDKKRPGVRRISRGSSWYSRARSCRCAYRYWYHPDYRDDAFGFRIVFKKGTKK